MCRRSQQWLVSWMLECLHFLFPIQGTAEQRCKVVKGLQQIEMSWEDMLLAAQMLADSAQGHKLPWNTTGKASLCWVNWDPFAEMEVEDLFPKSKEHLWYMKIKPRIKWKELSKGRRRGIRGEPRLYQTKCLHCFPRDEDRGWVAEASQIIPVVCCTS